MNHNHTESPSGNTETPANSKTWIVAAAMLTLIGGFFLLREHWSHIAGYWPYLLLLACPLMHLFHGHGGHGAHGDDSDKK